LALIRKRPLKADSRDVDGEKKGENLQRAGLENKMNSIFFVPSIGVHYRRIYNHHHRQQ
jgi:hypothetical protein